MSEQLRESAEHKVENIDTGVESAKNAERLREEAAKTPEKSKHEVEQLQAQAKEKAISGKETSVGERQESNASPTITRGLKQEAYRKTLRHIQGQLSLTQRSLSHVIHQPVVEKISNVGAQTVARPSGILGGAIFAFLGSVGLLVISKRVGFTYNYLLFLILFVGGFVVGLVLELLLRMVRRPKR